MCSGIVFDKRLLKTNVSPGNKFTSFITKIQLLKIETQDISLILNKLAGTPGQDTKAEKYRQPIYTHIWAACRRKGTLRFEGKGRGQNLPAP
jgi:hypothetical protein